MARLSFLLFGLLPWLLATSLLAHARQIPSHAAAEWVRQALEVAKEIRIAHDDPSSSLFPPEILQLAENAPGRKTSWDHRPHFARKRTSREISEEIRDFVNGLMECYNSIGLSLSVVFQDEVVIADGFGMRDLATQQAADKDTLFSIGSTSKAFSSTLAAMAVGEEKLDWDTPVREYVPEFHLGNDFADDKANTRDLLAHRVGVPRNDMLWITKPNATREEMISRLRHFPNDRDFRDEFEYNNWMVFTGGYAAAKQLGGSWEEVVSEHIFQPLGMTRTTTGVEGALALGNVARCYSPRSDGGFDPLPEDVNSVITLLAPAGAIHSSAVDMAKWMRFHLRGGVTEGGVRLVHPMALWETYRRQFALARSTKGTMVEPYFPVSFYLLDSGMGWFSATYRGRRVATHTGSTIGHTTLVFLLPDEDIGVFMSGNNPSTDGRLQALVALFVTDLLLDLDPWLDVPIACGFPCTVVPCAGSAKPSEAISRGEAQRLRENLPPVVTDTSLLQEYVGSYHDPGYDTFDVSLKNGTSLYFEFNELRGVLLAIPGQGEVDTLFVLPEDWYGLMLPILPVKFSRNQQGNIATATIPVFEPLHPPVFVKQQ